VKPTLEERARRARSRAAVKRWEYRQRNLAHGAWYQLRRVLVDAREAYSIPLEEARALLAEGYRPEPAGARIEPAKVILFVPAERIETIALRRRVPIRLGGELLAAEALALVRFEL
jgi:hypothetical protein